MGEPLPVSPHSLASLSSLTSTAHIHPTPPPTDSNNQLGRVESLRALGESSSQHQPWQLTRDTPENYFCWCPADVVAPFYRNIIINIKTFLKPTDLWDAIWSILGDCPKLISPPSPAQTTQAIYYHLNIKQTSQVKSRLLNISIKSHILPGNPQDTSCYKLDICPERFRQMEKNGVQMDFSTDKVISFSG